MRLIFMHTFFSFLLRAINLLSKDRKNIIYSNKSWNDVTSKYDLLDDLEIVIKKESSEPVTDQSHTAVSHTSLLSRSAIFIALLAVIGNIPVQSHLIKDASADSTVKTFEIIPAKIEIASNTIDTPHLISTHKDFR